MASKPLPTNTQMGVHLNRKTPLVAKLGVFTLVSASLAGFGGFLFHTLSKQAAQFLAVALGSALSASLVTVWTIRYNGVVSLLPKELDEPLLEWDVLQTVRYLNSTFDIEAAKKLVAELAPLAIAKDEAESKRAISNMGTYYQKIFTTKGLIGLLPPEMQRKLLPKNSKVITPPDSIPEGRIADLESQTLLFKELLWLRITEFRDDLATRSTFVHFLKVVGEGINKLYQFVKQNTSSDLQVTVIMSVLVLLVIRICLVVTLFFLRRAMSILYL